MTFVPSGIRPVMLTPGRYPLPPFPSDALGVGHPDRSKSQSLSDMRRTDARTAGIDRPDGVIRSFHVSLNKLEPSKAVLARNLFAKDDCRAALLDEMEERGP